MGTGVWGSACERVASYFSKQYRVKKILTEWCAVSKKGGILLANLLQGSRSTFSCVRFPSFFAFQDGMWDTQFSALLSSPTVSARILLVNLLQRSRSTFSWGSFLSFFAFKEGMLDTPISALGGWATVTHR